MAQLKSNSTTGGSALANIKLDGVSKSNFTSSQLAQIKGSNGSNGSNGASADGTTWSVAGTTITITGSDASYSLVSGTLSINTI